MTKIAVLGSGNAGQAVAADSKLAGKEVRMFEFSEYKRNIEGIMKTKEIELYGPERNAKGFKRNGKAYIDMITTDIAEAVTGADLLVVCVRASSYERLFRELIPHLADGQVITIFPDNYGSLILRKLMREAKCDKKVIIGGWSSLPYGARLTDIGKKNRVYIMYRAVSLRFDTLPSCDSDQYAKAVKELPPLDTVAFDHGDTMLDIGFSNVNPILHVPSTIMNVGTIDNWGIIEDVGTKEVFYDIYRHGFSPNVAKIQWEVYQEEVATAKKLGVGIQPYNKDVFFTRTSILGPEFMGEGYSIPFEKSIPVDEWMKYLPGERFTVESRYITEDIPVGCNVYYQLAKKVGVDCPAIYCMISLASIISGVNYFETGFSLSYLGIDKLDIKDLNSYLRIP